MSTTTARARRTGRRSPLTTVALLAIGLLFTGGAYALIQTGTASAQVDLKSAQTIDEGQKLFGSNCATCHGMDATGTGVAPSLIGVGAASVDFQVGTGRMPLQATTVQAEEKPTQFTDDQVKELAAYVASLAPGPAIPASQYLDGQGDPANGAELFRINCAMCHNVAGAGGALTEAKFAPSLKGVDPVHIYEAMVTGPQNMPVFNDTNISPEDKRDIITSLQYIEQNSNVGGADLGGLGPVSEGLFMWIFGLGGIVALTVWLTAKSN
ncbi:MULTISPECIES: cytochrome bc1 complex diheme cytochrome c subunit [Clavibacter]|uniref:Cytochrome bc1 complex cytochrome c subunit n=1 Tax=Clavibacter tessellarius TaxID=31965 RepID=A0A154V293_9MICO|nr:MULTISPECIES: cytochrome c [Clavibacter]KZC95496.1 cystathionine beta-lyase [Clavibacter michiganensis subsp. tessellarius]MDA3805899.1 cytochrome c [Clavibacter sp. CT19]